MSIGLCKSDYTYFLDIVQYLRMKLVNATGWIKVNDLQPEINIFTGNLCVSYRG